MDYEVWIFCTIGGLWMALIFVLIGVAIGKTDNKKSDKDDPGNVLQRNDDIRIYHRGDYHNSDRDVGDNHRKEPDRCHVGHVHEMTGEELGAVLRAMVAVGSYLTPHEKDYLEEAAERLGGEIE